MSLRDLFARKPAPARIEPRLSPAPALEARYDALGVGSISMGPIGTAGAAVSVHVAENLATVSACIGAIASTIATLPATVYRRDPAGRTEVRDHPVARLLRAPCDRLTWPDFVEWLLAQTLLYGNAIAVIQADGAGRPVALLPVPWPFVQILLLESGRLAYDVAQFIAPWGGTGVPRRYLDGEVLHLRDRSDDGYLGRSRLSRAPDVLGAAIGIQTYSTAIWQNAATPSGALKHPGKMSREAKDFLTASFERRNAGAHNAKRTVVLDEGMTFEPMAMTPEDSEVLESRRFTVEELCRLYQVPPPIVQDYSHGTFTNAAQAALWFAQLTLTPWCRKIEAEFARSVFGDNSDFHLEIDLSGLMRGDFAARWASYQVAIASGILTVDEVREAEGYNPLSRTEGEPPPQPDV